MVVIVVVGYGIFAALGVFVLCLNDRVQALEDSARRLLEHLHVEAAERRRLEQSLAATDAWLGLDENGTAPPNERTAEPLDEYLDSRERELCEWCGVDRMVRVALYVGDEDA